ncbi:uncharacterized protein N7511_005297 [Penicillium nucicola]|uniref:uncharacterized protein n=1 Tax=Penicillium nucicola TaxID=1850975 RepID=UPI00254566B5|nr:uncharacterized protein N7511_005297 [Penicillium nucicola]KAJ5761915.1 hypothetical protein N7511_005297 [Penicillium nucicola]
MAAQAALIADTITGMKRALRREREGEYSRLQIRHNVFSDVFSFFPSIDSGPDDPIMQPTNRGNKMHANAKYVREGAMGYINAEDFYKQKVDHAGYTRYILQSNPIRYDSEGDELDEDDEDSEADAAAAEDNPFSGIALETLLCPLKHPSELAIHPSLSQPYTSQALEQMTTAVDLKLRQERALLWRARNLHRQFLGDGGWMPCGTLETPDDRWIFEPKIVSNETSISASQQGPSLINSPSVNGEIAAPHEAPRSVPATIQSTENTQEQNDVEMSEIPASFEGEAINNHALVQPTEFKSEETDATVKDLPPHPTETAISGGIHEANTKANGKHESENPKDSEPTLETDQNEQDADMEDDAEMHDGSSPEPPRRMTTRAQANATNPSDGNQSPLSSVDTADTLPTPHPLFMIPDNVRPDANFGLPAAEAEETRRLLWSYIQKQEETVRGFEHMFDSLIKACRMKADVLEWSKAEGHVGEMSDGEDWYDREKWGLTEGEDLKKGTDEDEVETVDESRTQAKRGRGRRQ